MPMAHNRSLQGLSSALLWASLLTMELCHCLVVPPGSVARTGHAGACLRMRGGSAAKGKPDKAGLNEEALKRMLGVKYMLDLSQESDRKTLIKLVREHREEGGQFNMVKKDGEDYQIFGVVGADEDEEGGSHFDGMKGQAAQKIEAPQKGGAGSAVRNAVKDKLQYSGLQYSAADLSKMTRSEREYRMQLMAMSKDEVKMEMPGGELLNGALNLYKSWFGKKDEETGDEPTGEAFGKLLDNKLPSKGILHFRFKSRPKKTTSATASSSSPLQSAAWASARKTSVARSASSGVAKDGEEEEEVEESFLQKVQRMATPKYIATTILGIAFKVVSTVLGIVASILKSLTGRSAKSDMMRVRKQQTAAPSG
uniref:Uncharacterized protein n=1 Tax=Hemiselmis andersenii TaxID=464988 RepID=A0A6T8PQK5_HEMAN|mmetsp:Transcript_12763/g.31276  ORF Transcript_12763/g.31276 Transcript_12763/m.31276 type:complete len:367 (+) Transcript_12763:32-1132(+)